MATAAKPASPKPRKNRVVKSAQQPNNQPNNQPKTKGAGRPKESHPLRSFKNAATGETRNSPFTDPNIIFLVGGSLIIASQWTRIKKTFAYAWNANNETSKQPDGFFKNLKVIAVQILFVFILTITARAVPALGRIWLVTLGGLWLLWLMRNPEVLQLLQVASE